MLPAGSAHVSGAEVLDKDTSRPDTWDQTKNPSKDVLGSLELWALSNRPSHHLGESAGAQMAEPARTRLWGGAQAAVEVDVWAQ